MLKVYIVHVLVIYNINLQHYMYIVHTNFTAFWFKFLSVNVVLKVDEYF